MAGEAAPLTEETDPRGPLDVPFHPLLVAAAPVLLLWAENAKEVRPSAVLGPLSVALAVGVALWALSAALLRSVLKGALLASALAVIVLSFGHFSVSVASGLIDIGLLDWAPFLSLRHLHWGALAVGALLVGTLGVWLARTPRPLGRPTRVLNAASAALVGMTLVNALARSGDGAVGAESALADGPPVHGTTPGGAGGPPDAGARPDVYLILLDAYPRHDVQRDHFGRDGEPFLRELEARGFQVARRSHANYSTTMPSVVSMFELDYLDDLREAEERPSLSRLTERLRGGTLLDLLEVRGYETVGFDASYTFTRLTSADTWHEREGIGGDEFRYAFLEMTLFPLVLGELWETAWLSERARKREDTRFLLETVPLVARDPDPTFAWVHLQLPHPPFVFGADGEDISLRYRYADERTGGMPRTSRQAELYIEAQRAQLDFTDREVLRLVDAVLEASPGPPVIVLLSDHGSRLNVVWGDMEATDLREALANLTAVRVPGGELGGFYDWITPVNLLRLVLSSCLGAELPPLADRSYHNPSGQPWRFVDVTGRLWPGGGHPDPPAPSGAGGCGAGTR